MRINSINSTTPKFKGVREDRNTTSQLKQSNDYSLTELNQRRINKAIENLAKQRGEDNIRFLLNVGENLTYQTNIPNAKPTKNNWRSKLKRATESSLAISDPVLKEKYEPEIFRVFDEPKPLSDAEKEIIMHRDSIMYRADLKGLEKHPNPNIRNLESNMDYFISSTETPTNQKRYVMERLDYMMSPDYKINPQLKDKKTQVLAEIMNDLVINTPESNIPNIKAVNQKTHGMCAAISIARKAIAYEDKQNYVDTILSELDESPKVMVYDRHNLGSGKKVPVDKTYVDFDYAQDKGYRIIDASTLQWMGIAGMYGTKNEKLNDFFAFDKENFDAFHDSFFVKTIGDTDVSAKHNYFQALVKAKDEIGSVKASRVRKDVNKVNLKNSAEKNIKIISKYNDNTKSTIKSVVPDISEAELKEDFKVLHSLYNAHSDSIKKQDESIQKYSFLPNEESSQKIKKVKSYFVDKYSDRVFEKDFDKNAEAIVSNVSAVHSLEKSLSNSDTMSGKVAQARKLYNAEATYRASIAVGLREEDTLTDYLIHYNIPDKESRISEGYQTVIDRISKNDDKKLQNHFAAMLGCDPQDKKGIVEGLQQIKESIDYIQTEGLDSLYESIGAGSRRQVLNSELNSAQAAIEQGDKSELHRLAVTMGVKEDKKRVLGQISKYQADLAKQPDDEKLYKTILNKTGSKNEMRNYLDVHTTFLENIQRDDEFAPVYKEMFKNINELEGCSEGEFQEAVNNIGSTFNTFAQSMANAESILNVPNDDGTMYFSVSDASVVMKKMENEGKLVPVKSMMMLQDRFNKIDKIRSSDEFSGRSGKISDPALYKFSAPEKEAVKKIDSKLNRMYSDVVEEHTRIYRDIRLPLEKHAKRIGTNTGKYWVSQDGHSGLNSAQQVKIFEQMTDKPYQTVDDVEKALNDIKNSAHSGVSSTSVFSHDHGWHAQYIADVTEAGKDNNTVILHDNTWGASEHENTWVDSEGLMRTDYSDRRGGDDGYITDKNYRNGNYIKDLTRKPGHITPDDVESKTYRKIHPKGEEYDFSTISDIIMQGKSSAYKDIAAQIKDTIFVPDSVFVPDIKKHASKMSSKEIQKAIFRNETAGTMYHTKFDKIQKRVKGDAFHKGISTLEDYNKLSDNDPVKLTFEKAAIRLAYDDAPMYKELGTALDMKSAMKVKSEQRKRAVENFDYAFGKSPDVFSYLAQDHARGVANILVDSLKRNNLPEEKSADIAKGLFVLSDDEKAKFTGSTKDTIDLVLNKFSKQYDEAMDNSDASKQAKSEITAGMRDLLSNALYFNKDDMNFESDKAKGIENWIDEKFEPKTDEEFVQVYNTLQDMDSKDFAKLRADVTDKQLGMSGVTGFDVLEKFNAANEDAESTVRNILFYEEYSKDMDQSKTKDVHKCSKLNRKTRGAVYVGSRTFDDLYRSMYFSLSTLTYEKMFNKWKDTNFRNYGALPAYPVVDLDNNKGIKKEVDELYNKVGSSMADIIQKKTVQRDYAIVDSLDNFVKQLNPEKTPTAPQLKHVQKLAGKFITLNMNDTSVADSLEAAYKILEMKRGVSHDELSSNVGTIVKEFDVIRKANSGVDLDKYMNTQKEFMKKFTDTIIDINVPPRYQRKVKESAAKWQSLELKYAIGDRVEDNNYQLLQSKIDKVSVKTHSEKQTVSFEKIEDLVNKTKKLKSTELDRVKIPEEEINPSEKYEKQAARYLKVKVQENEAKIAEMTDKYVDRFIKEGSRENIKANISDWTRQQIHGGKRRKITEDEVLDARDKFENDFYKYHLAKNPIELLNTFLLISSKDADKNYPTMVGNKDIYERLVSDELTLTKFVEIQDALMEAVQTGNTAHVKEYFDDYHIDQAGQVSMNSDGGIDYMVRSLMMEDNTKPAKMFVEKLGLGDRVMDIEVKSLHESKPKKQVDKLVRELRKINDFQKVVVGEKNALMSTIDTAEDADDAIEKAKQNILIGLKDKRVKKTMIKAYMAALDDVKKSIKDNPEMQRSLILDATHSTVVGELQEHINDDLQVKQAELSATHMLYKFLLDLRLPEYSDGYKKQQELAKEYDELLRYNNDQLNGVTANSDAISVQHVDE